MEKGEKSKVKEETPGGSGASSGIKRKKVYNVEPRTPLKRQRIPVARFQSPVLEEGAPKPKAPKEEIVILYKKGIFLAVRGAENSIYLCKTQQNVHSASRQFRIQWLNLDQPPNIYKMDYIDHTDIECVLTNVRMERISRDTFRLPKSEQERAEMILQKAVKVERGEPIDDEPIVQEDFEEEDEVDEEDEGDEEEWEEEETPRKGKSNKGKGKAQKKTKGLKIALTKGKKTKAGQKKEKDKKKGKGKDKKKEGKVKEEKKRGPDRKLKPNPKIKILEKSLFFESKDRIPTISKQVKTRQVIRAVLTKDMELLKTLIKSEKDVYKLDKPQSIENPVTAVDYCIRQGNKEMLTMLLEDIFAVKNTHDTSPIPCLIEEANTGTYNPAYLGIRNIRALNVSRGSKEGNTAFTKDIINEEMNRDYVLESVLKTDFDPEIFELVLSTPMMQHETREEKLSVMYENIIKPVLQGNRKLAAKLVAAAEKDGGYGFNFLHSEVLNFDKEDLRANILPASVRKKPLYGSAGMTPLHCACINPNVKFLSRLLQIDPDINLCDKSNRRLIHYAAVCEGSGPLELLLERGASSDEVDSQGNTPLHHACTAGRAHNADILLKKAKIKASSMGDFGASTKWGVGGINRGNRLAICPLHNAIYNGHTEVVKILIKHGVDLNKQLSAGREKKSPLMLAAERGNLDIARLLVQNGATVELLDKLKRSALTHAIINGNSNVASYLLYLGADPNRADSSGNTLIHYAAGYGWYFCLKMLINDASAECNKPNTWNTTPVAIAFLKGHMGIVGYLLNQPGVDINFKDDNGMTLTSIACRSRITSNLLSQVEYLVKEKKADPSVPDNAGMTSLHHLAGNSIKVQSKNWPYNEVISEESMETSVKIAECLLAAGCDPSSRTKDGQTPIMLAIEKVNTPLVRFLVDNGGTVSPEMNNNQQNVLHLMAQQCMQTDLAPLIEILADQKIKPTKKTKKVDTVKAADNAMEVDGREKPAELNGEKEEVKMDGEKEVAEDLSKKVNGEISEEAMEEEEKGESVLRRMSGAVDKSGLTPLLKACLVYKSFNANKSKLKPDAVERVYQHGRDFIRAMIDLAGSDINKSVEKKFQEDPSITYTDEASYYIKEAKYTALHMMVETSGEPKLERDGVASLCPGLQLILKYKPKLEQRALTDMTPLNLSVDLKKEVCVKALLDAGADPNSPYTVTKDGPQYPVLCAARTNQPGVLRLLVAVKANVNVHHQKTLKTPLHYIVQNRDNEALMLSMVQTLVQAGADINALDDHKRNVLHLAVNSNSGTSNASTDIEEYLIEKGVNVMAKDMRQRLPLHYTFVKINKHTDSSSLDPIEMCSLLTSVMGSKGIDDADAFGQTPLHCAAVRGATICCMHLLQRKAEIGKKDLTGNTPLSLAVDKRHESCAIMLIQRGASVRDHIVFPLASKDEKPKTDNDKKKRPVLSWRPLTQWDVKPAPEEKVTYPVFQGAIKDELQGVAHIVLDTAGMDFSAVEAALSVWKYNVVLRLMKRIPDASKLHTINEDGRNLFHILVLKAKGSNQVEAHLKVAHALRDKGVAVGLRDKYGCTPLHYAALYHQPKELAKFLMDNDPALDIKSKDRFGRDVLSAYMWNINSVDTQFVKMLLEKGASLDVRFDRPLPDPLLLGSCIQSKSPDYFKMKGDVQITPLILAIHYFQFSLVRFMLNEGASPNFEDSLRRTPMMHAARRNDIAISKLLLNYSYDPQGSPSDKPKLRLTKTLSRNVFMLKPDGTLSSMNSEIPEEEEENEDEENVSENNEEEEENEDEDQAEEEEEEPVEEEEPEEEEEEPEEEPEDSDHDTDVMDEEEDDDDKPQLKSVLSKQLSLRPQGSSLSRDEFPTVEKTSSVDLEATDNQGWTVIHHLVSPLELGTFDSEELLFVLAKAGASIDKKDNAGLSPLNYALIRGAPKIASRLQKLLNSEKEEKPTFTSFEVNNVLNDGVKVNFKEDYEKMYDKINEEVMEVNDADDNAELKPDKHCNIRNSSEIIMDSKQDIPYSILLSKVDVMCGSYGMYNFYRMQIVYQASKSLYVLFTRWGRIGDSGQFQHTPYQKKEEAVKEFCKIFKSKTGNDWNNVKSYVNHPKKYRLLPTEQKYCKAKQVHCSLVSEVPSKLPQALQDLVKEMGNDSMLQASIKKFGMNTEYMPFGRIKKESLIDARKILAQIGDLIDTTEKQSENLATTDRELYQKNCEKIGHLSNEYYHLVPSHGFENWAIRPLSEKRMLRKSIRFISDLLDIEVASRILLGSQMHLKDMNPLDYVYRSVGCSIEPLMPDSIEAQYILTYINASNKRSDIHAIYKVSRPGEEERLKALNMDNHRLLWHGSSISNFLSILNRGLLIAPPEIQITGHAFGEGIYFADSFSKSHGYCHNYSGEENGVKLMLLCQVALGKMKEDVGIDEDEHVDPDINSLKVRGRVQPSPDFNISMPFGTTIPMGMSVSVTDKPSPSMPHNEFIVYDSSQVCIRYLVMFSK